MIEQYVNAAELKRLFSTLLVFMGALLIAALFASIVVPGLRNANRPPTATPVNPVVGEPGWLDPSEFPPSRGREVAPIDPKILIAGSSELTARGKQLFADNCTQCHGDTGRGDGPAASTMTPRPRDFSKPEGWINGHTLPAMFKTVSTGLNGTSMPPFDYLAKTDRMALAHFVLGLGKFDHGEAGEESMERLSAELSAPGGKTPNRIPVSMAMAKLEREFVKPAPIVLSDEVLWLAITDPARAGQTLAQAQSWHEGPRALAEAVVPGAPANGFSSRLGTYTAAQWQAFFDALKGIK